MYRGTDVYMYNLTIHVSTVHYIHICIYTYLVVKAEIRLVWYSDPTYYIQNYAHAVVACASGKEGSGTKLYPNADQGWNVRKGVRMQL